MATYRVVATYNCKGRYYWQVETQAGVLVATGERTYTRARAAIAAGRRICKGAR